MTDNLDKYGRAIMYVKVGRNDGKEAAEAHQRLLMYTVERYARTLLFWNLLL